MSSLYHTQRSSQGVQKTNSTETELYSSNRIAVVLLYTVHGRSIRVMRHKSTFRFNEQSPPGTRAPGVDTQQYCTVQEAVTNSKSGTQTLAHKYSCERTCHHFFGHSPTPKGMLDFVTIVQCIILLKPKCRCSCNTLPAATSIFPICSGSR